MAIMIKLGFFQLKSFGKKVACVSVITTFVLFGCTQKQSVNCADIVNEYVAQYKDSSFGKLYSDSRADLIKNAELCTQELGEKISSRDPSEVEAIADFAFEMPNFFKTDRLVALETDWRGKMVENEDSNIAVFQLAKAITAGEPKIALPYVRNAMMENEIAGAGVLHGLLQQGRDDLIEIIIEECLNSSEFKKSAKGIRLLRKYSISLMNIKTNSSRMKSLGLRIQESIGKGQ